MGTVSRIDANRAIPNLVGPTGKPVATRWNEPEDRSSEAWISWRAAMDARGQTMFGGALTEWCAAWKAEQLELSARAYHDKRELDPVERAQRIHDSGAKLTDQLAATLVSGQLDNTPTRSRVAAWLADPDAKPWIVLSGSTGRGKTVAALDAIACRGGMFIRARELARAFTAKFGDDHELQQSAYRCRLLVIDDLGRETDRAAMCGYLEDLLDERPNVQHRTIVTTNLDPKQFVETYPDERLRSRLYQLAEFVSDKGSDMRRGGK